MRKKLAILAGLLILLAINLNIYQREQLLAKGRIVLLELAPVDPRSLMQGDYMALNFAIVSQAFGAVRAKEAKDGHIVASLDQNGIARFVRFANEKPVDPGEILLRYRIRNGQVKFATDAFFFQEGQAQVYEAAKYGKFRVAENGDMMLTEMLDARLASLPAP